MKGYEDWFNKVHMTQKKDDGDARGNPVPGPATLSSPHGEESMTLRPEENFAEAGKDMDNEAPILSLKHMEVSDSLVS